MGIKKTFLLIIMLLFSSLLVACTTTDNNNDQEIPPIIDPIEPVKEVLYTVYNGKDAKISENKNIWTAIIEAGGKSKNSDRHYVKDQNETIVYKYSLTKYYKYLSDQYVGETEDKDEAFNWAKQFPNSYVIDGKAQEFINLGDQRVPANSTFTRGFEFYTGSYTYMFSKKYTQNSNNTGFAYINFKLRFSEATLTYQKESTEKGYNAYVFVNTMMDNPWANNDMGIMNGWEAHKGYWLPVFNLNGNTYNPDVTKVITKMELIDEETDTWGNADDLFFEIYVSNEKYIMNIKNLATNEQFSFSAESSNLNNNAHKTYLLLAASFVPVLKNTAVWNPRNGASFENIIFEDVKVAHYDPSNDYTNAQLYNYGPGQDATDYTLLEAADNVTLEYGTHLENGTYQKGGVFTKGTNYIMTSIFYDYRQRS